MTNVGERAQRFGREAENSDWLDRGVRFGMVAYGVVHLVVSWLAIQLALGAHGKNASQKGAMQTLAHQSFGPVLLWLITVGMFVLVLWRVLEVFSGHREYDGGKRWRRRAASALKAIIYAYIGYTALRYAMGSGSSSNSTNYTRTLMDQPFGRWLVGLVGVAIIAYGVNYARRGWTEKFMENLDARGASGDTGTAYRWLGKVGYIAKGIAFCVVGGLFIAAAVTHHAKKSGGLDQALHTVLQQPLGPVLLVLIAVGIACYGLFCFARARHLST
ncbi:MAG TPA: DUF1206 domain-containing protein [Nocardioides sp.]|nr:DUF1206 domain-containing protein [Nocardioides sp.]